MAEDFKDQSLIAMLPTGVSVLLCRWSSEDSEYDAAGWVEAFGSRLGNGVARLPDGGVADLSKFCAVQPKVDVP